MVDLVGDCVDEALPLVASICYRQTSVCLIDVTHFGKRQWRFKLMNTMGNNLTNSLEMNRLIVETEFLPRWPSGSSSTILAFFTRRSRISLPAKFDPRESGPRYDAHI